MKHLDKHTLILLFLLIVGSIFRLYNLNWGSPFYFHPDERNIASAVTRIVFPTQLNPDFFAYGSLPVYANVILAMLLQITRDTSAAKIFIVRFEDAILASRIFSSVFSILLIPCVYFLVKQLRDRKTAILASFLTTFCTGFIQFAHFGTFEMWLTLGSIILCLLCIKSLKTESIFTPILLGLVSGILIGVKISSIVLLPLPILTLFLIHARHIRKDTTKKKILKIAGGFFGKTIICIVVAASIFFLTNPYSILEYNDYRSTIEYEADVASGKLDVFYTGEFFDTSPVLYQLRFVYPFLLNPLITAIGIVSILYIGFRGLWKKEAKILITFLFFAILFLSQAILFVKWTRYMIPTLPFLLIAVAIAWSDFDRKFLKTFPQFSKIISLIGFSLLVGSSIIFSSSYFFTVFAQKDSRIQASDWAKDHLVHDAKILSEVFDMGIVSFNDSFSKITLFHFYDLEFDTFDANEKTLKEQLSESSYLILPSQRIFKTRLIHALKFPKGHEFYSSLRDGKSVFTKIYETPCDIFCKIVYLGDPLYRFESTANVFDRPVIQIYKNNYERTR